MSDRNRPVSQFATVFYIFAILLVLSPRIFGQSCSLPAAGLADLYGGDNSPNDLVGAANGVLANGAGYTSNPTGKVGPAFNLDGTDGQVNVTSAINLGSTFSVELWIYPTRSIGFEHLVSNDYHSAANFGALYFQSDHLEYWQNSSVRTQTPAGSIPLNTWSHIGLVYNGGVATLFINGVASGTPSVVHSESFNTTLELGYAIVGSDNHFKGRLDEVSFYNSALTAADLLAITNAGPKGKCVAPSLFIDDASILEGNSGTSTLNFTITSIRTNAATQVTYTTADGTATQGSDYISGTGTVGVTGTATVPVTVNGDPIQEPNETFLVNLSSPVGAAIVDAQAIGTIYSDDCAAPTLGVTNWYRGEGNGIDSAGGATGTLENGIGFGPGNTGQAFSLDGINDSVLTPTLNIGSAYTVELWIYPTGTSTYQNLVSNSDHSVSNYGSLYVNVNKLEYWENFQQLVLSPTPIPLNQWSHVAVVYDGAVTRLYLNGVATGNPSVAHLETFNNPVRIGYSAQNRDQYFSGSLDEVTLYNRPLTAAEILAIYNTGGGGKCLAAAGDNWTGAVSTDWNTAGNWSGGVPTSSTDVVIPAVGVTNEPSIASSDVTINSLSVGAGNTLTVGTGRTLNVSNDLINNAAISGAGTVNAGGATVSNSGTISTATFNFTHIGVQNLSGSGSFSGNTETIFPGANVTLTSDHQLSTLALLNGAALNLTNRTLSVSGNLTSSGVINITGSTVVANGSTPQTLSLPNYINLTANNAAGVNLGADATVNNLLTLTSDLNTGPFTLSQPYQTQDSAGDGDVIGNVRLMNPTGGFASYYGNRFNRISLSGGTFPTSITVNLVKSAPADYLNAIKRTYTVTPSGGSGYTATVQFHYQDSDLNGNVEADLNLQRKGATWVSQGFTARDTTDNWVNKAGVTQFSPWTLAVAAPTAANVSVSGRVTTPEEAGIVNAILTLTGEDGSVRTVTTGRRGIFQFDDVEAGHAYTLRIASRRFVFDDPVRVIYIVDELTDVNFISTDRGASTDKVGTRGKPQIVTAKPKVPQRDRR